jgi:hypothetical protein
VKDISIFGVISVGKVHYRTNLTTGAELQKHISRPQLTRKTTVNFQNRDEGREIGSPTLIGNIYRIYNSVCNEAYKYDFMIVVNCNSYNIFSCV